MLHGDLERMIAEYSPLVFHVAFTIVRDRGLAEDVVQETMIKAWRSKDSFRGESSARTWLVKICRNTAIDSLRRQRRVPATVGELPDSADASASADTERIAQGRDEVSRLAGALDSLDELSRTVILLREVEAMSYQEISEVMDVPVSTVKTRLLRARRRLVDSMQTAMDGT